MLNKATLVAPLLILAFGSQGAAAQSPPLVKGTALPPGQDGLPESAANTPPPVLRPLDPAVMRAQGVPAPLCEAASGEGVLLAAGADRRALANPAGGLVPLLHEGPELRLGGYFTADALSIVIEPDSGSSRQNLVDGVVWTEWRASVVTDLAGRNRRDSVTWRCRN